MAYSSPTPEELYALRLRGAELYWLLEDNTIAVRDCGEVYGITRRGVVLTPCSFIAENVQKSILKCSCQDGMSENILISDTLPIIESELRLNDFIKRRQKNYCIHARTVLLPSFFIKDGITYANLINPNTEINIPVIEDSIAYLSERPRLIAVNDEVSWSILGVFGSKGGLVCLSAQCSNNQSKCSHLEYYVRKCNERGIDPQLYTACNDDPINTVRSERTIPFPLSAELQLKCQNLSNGLEHYPNEIRPEQGKLEGCCGLR